MKLFYRITMMVVEKTRVLITRAGWLSVFLPFAFFGQTMACRAIDPTATEESVKKGERLKAALRELNLPGVTVNVKERCVDIDSLICLDSGVLEFIACTKNTKEHESLVAIEALPKHVHTALLLIGAKSGSPATRKPVDKERTQWINIPASGGEVDVFLLIDKGEGEIVERPISDFIERLDDSKDVLEDGGRFPTNTFIFAGSRLQGKGESPRVYLADVSGSVISVATFGDELLCLPDVSAHTAGALLWQVNSKNLPSVGSKVTLRLRPRL